MENLHVDLAFTAATIGTGIASVGVLRAVERHAVERARRRTKDILARLGGGVSSEADAPAPGAPARSRVAMPDEDERTERPASEGDGGPAARASS